MLTGKLFYKEGEEALKTPLGTKKLTNIIVAKVRFHGDIYEVVHLLRALESMGEMQSGRN